MSLPAAPYERYLEAERFLNEGLIRLGRSLNQDRLPPFDPKKKMDAMRSFMAALGNPERGLPTLHVAGTSGKGSVSAAAAAHLRAAGFRVGLHVSPYLQAAVEKTWIDGQYVSGDAFADAVAFVRPAAERFLQNDAPASVHGMASIAASLELMRRAAVDIVVFEVGCGGRFDLSSIVESCVSVVTNVGMDHVRTLGPELKDIAWHKAGVARPKVPLITGTTGIALTVVREEATRVGAPLTEVPPEEDVFAHNRKLAVAAAQQTAAVLGRSISPDENRTPVALPGRAEKMPGTGPSVYLDGAHNPDKLAAAVRAALRNAPAGPRIGLIGLLGAKAGPEIARTLAGHFDALFVTEPRVYGKSAAPIDETVALFKEAGCPVTAIGNPDRALDAALDVAGTRGTLLVTGSFYLAGQLRERWYPKAQVVLQRTSFPH